MSRPSTFVALLAGIVALAFSAFLSAGAQPAGGGREQPAEPPDVSGSTTIDVGAAVNGVSFRGKNKTGRNIADYTIELKSDHPNDCPSNITRVEMTGDDGRDWPVDQNLGGKPGKNEDASTVHDPGLVERVDHPKGDDTNGIVRPDSNINIKIKLKPPPKKGGACKIVLTPTDLEGLQIASLPGGLKDGENFVKLSGTAVKTGLAMAAANGTAHAISALSFTSDGHFTLLRVAERDPKTDAKRKTSACSASSCTLALSAAVTPRGAVVFDVWTSRPPRGGATLTVTPVAAKVSPTSERTASPGTPVTPTSGSEVVAGEQAYLPSTSGVSGYVTGTIVDPTSTTGASDFVYSYVDAQGRRSFFKSVTDSAKHFVLPISADMTALEVARHFDRAGKLANPAHCDVGIGLSVPNTRDILNPPASGPAIVGGESVFERSKPIALHTRGIEPRSARLLIDGKSDGQQVLAASDSSVIGEVSVQPGTHTASLTSASGTTNGIQADFVDVNVSLTGSNQIGGTKVATLTAFGIAHPATATFRVSGASVLRAGGSELTVPLQAGRASVDLRNVSAGRVAVRWLLHVSIPAMFPEFAALATTLVHDPKKGTTLSHPGGATTTVDPKTGHTTSHNPKTGTTITVDPKKKTTTAKDNKTGKTASAPTDKPGKTSTGGKNGEPKIDVDVTVKQNPDGTTTTTAKVTVTANGQTTTTTVTTTTDNNGGHTTTATDPEDPNSSTSTTVDKNGDVTKTGTSTTNPDGTKTETSTDAKTGATTTTTPGGSYTATPNPDGSIHIDYNTPSGSGGSINVPEGSTITPNTPSATNPLPFNYTPPPK